MFFFFKQKTAYEIKECDWSSDVCSSDLKYRIGRIYNAIYDVIRHPGGTDHNIDQETIDRNDEAKDHMRLNAIHRRQALNQSS